MNNIFSDEQWNTIQQFDAHGKSEPKYTKAEKITFWFCCAVIFYLIFQILRVAA